jgi:hypothetical protein
MSDMSWQPIETAPHMKAILIHYQREFNGKTFDTIIKGIYYDKFAIESMDEEAEYDEETDEYYVPEGWYEMIDNWDEYASSKLYPEHKPTHWMPLPALPKEDL